MMLQLHRSITFGSGLLVMVFVCWAWWDSASHASSAAWQRVSANSASHGIAISHYTMAPRGWITGRSDINPRDSGPGPNPMLMLTTTPKLSHGEFITAYQAASNFREKTRAKLNLSGTGSFYLYIPYWLVLLAVAALWLGLLVWRARRMKRFPPLT